jgi:hypothetical protein
MTHEDPIVPWLDRRLKARVEDFELVLKSRFPSVHDHQTRGWGKTLGRVLAQRRWDRGSFADPHALRAVRRWSRRVPDDRQAYGHLRPPGEPATNVEYETAPGTSQATPQEAAPAVVLG